MHEPLTNPADASTRSRRAPAWIAAALSLAVIAMLTLVPAHDGSLPLAPSCLLCGDRGVADAIVNVLLFAPLGAALAWAGLRWTRVLLVGLCLAGVIELLQSAIPGRSPTYRDVLLNGLGAGGAALLLVLADRWLPLPALTARRLAWACAPLPVLLVAITAWVLAAAPPHDDWYALWQPELENMEQWQGRVDTATLGTVPLPNGRLRNTPAVRTAYTSRLPLRLRVHAGAPPSSLAPIFAIYDAQSREVLLLGASRDDVVLRRYLHATALRLDQPDLRWRGALAGIAAGRALDIELELVERTACLVVDGARTCAPLVAAGAAWSLLAWQDGWARGLPSLALDALTLTCVLALVTLLARWGGSTAPTVVALLLLVAAIGLGWAPSPRPLEWLGLGLGVVAGAVAASATSRRAAPSSPTAA